MVDFKKLFQSSENKNQTYIRINNFEALNFISTFQLSEISKLKNLLKIKIINNLLTFSAKEKTNKKIKLLHIFYLCLQDFDSIHQNSETGQVELIKSLTSLRENEKETKLKYILALLNCAQGNAQVLSQSARKALPKKDDLDNINLDEWLSELCAIHESKLYFSKIFKENKHQNCQSYPIMNFALTYAELVEMFFEGRSELDSNKIDRLPREQRAEIKVSLLKEILDVKQRPMPANIDPKSLEYEAMSFLDSVLKNTSSDFFDRPHRGDEGINNESVVDNISSQESVVDRISFPEHVIDNIPPQEHDVDNISPKEREVDIFDKGIKKIRQFKKSDSAKKILESLNGMFK